MMAEVILIFVEEMTLGALKLRKRFLARNSPKYGYGIKIFCAVITNDKVF
jgi:hypothetical protein